MSGEEDEEMLDCTARPGRKCEWKMKSPTEKVCTKCGRVIYYCEARQGKPCVFQEKNAEEVCIYCGRIGKRILFTGQQKVFEHGDEKNLHADGGKALGDPGTKMGEVFSSNASSLTPGYRERDRTIVAPGFEKRKPRDAAIENFRHMLDSQCERMQLSKKTKNDCMDLFNHCARNGILSKSQITPLLLGILFHGCKKGDLQLTVKDLAKMTKQKEETVRKGMKIVGERCSAMLDREKVESSSLIHRYCIRLGMDASFMNMFVSNAKSVDEKIRQFLEGKKPNTVAATDIYLTLKWFYSDPYAESWSLSKIAEAADLKATTLRKSIADVQKGMSDSGMTSDRIVQETRDLLHA